MSEVLGTTSETLASIAEGASDDSPLRRQASLSWLRILATSDLHAQILPWDDYADRPAPERSLAQIATLIRAARAEQPHSVLLDNGDFLNGNPLADHVAAFRPLSRQKPHPVIAAMNLLGYDAATLGNHEFSMGLAFLRRALRAASFPVVSANLFRVAGGRRRTIVPRFVLLPREVTDDQGQRHRVTVGIIGFLPPQTVHWERNHLGDRFQSDEILACARKAIPGMRRAGADLVVALAHSGLGSREPGATGENAALSLTEIEGIDLVIAGHTHQIYPERVGMQAVPTARCPLVMPGAHGSHLGVVDLHLALEDRKWTVVEHRIELRPVARRAARDGQVEPLAQSAPDICEIAAKDHDAMRQRARVRIGLTKAPLNSYFALAGKSAIQTLLAEALGEHAAALLSGRPEAALPLLVAVAPFKTGGRGGPDHYTDIAPGPLTRRSTADLYCHPNSTVLIGLSGAEVAHWLERSVSLFNQIAPGARDAPLVNPAFPSYNFDMIHGLTYEVDLSQPPRFTAQGAETGVRSARIHNLCHLGRPVRPEMRFVLATNSYRAAGGAGFPGTDAAHIILQDPRALRQVLEDHIRRKGTVAPSRFAGWSLTPCRSATVVLESSPSAADFAKDLKIEPLAVLPSGFQRFRIAL